MAVMLRTFSSPWARPPFASKRRRGFPSGTCLFLLSMQILLGLGRSKRWRSGSGKDVWLGFRISKRLTKALFFRFSLYLMRCHFDNLDLILFLDFSHER